MRNRCLKRFLNIFFCVQDVEKKGDDSDESEESDNDDDPDKQMGETEEGAEK